MESDFFLPFDLTQTKIHLDQKFYNPKQFMEQF